MRQSSFIRHAAAFALIAALALLAVAPLNAQTLPAPREPGAAHFKPRHVPPADARPAQSATTYLLTLRVPAGRDGLFAPEAVAAAQDSVRAALPASARIKVAYSHLPILSIEVDSADAVALRANPLIATITPDRTRRMMDAEADVLTDAPFVRALGYKGKGVRAAVIDSGIDTDHPSSALLNSMFFQRCFRTEGDCPAGVENAEDQDGHGTHVAGIITGSGGVAPAAKVAALKVFTTGDTSDTNILNALNYIVAQDAALKIDMVNLSLGGDLYDSESECNADNPPYVAAFSALNGLGIAVFVATGNDFDSEFISAPACVTGAIGVGSINDADGVFCDDDVYTGVTCFSNATPVQGPGELVDILAPGCSILSEYIGGGYEEICGTSMATPMALGIAALLLDFQPSLTPAQIEMTLEESGSLVLDVRNGAYFPAVNAHAAYGGLVVPPPSGLAITGTSGTSTTLSWIDSAGETSYILERSANGKPFHTIATPAMNVVTITDSALTCGTLDYRLRAMQGDLVSLPSNVASRAAVETCPNAPTNLRWAFLAPDNFRLTWDDNDSTETGFGIERSADGVNFTQIDTAAANAEQYDDTSPSGCTEFAYRVFAYRQDDFISASEPTSAAFAGCPPANDLFANAETITSSGDTETAIRYAQVQPDDHSHSCRFSGVHPGGATVWYTFVAPMNGFVVFSTDGSTYDTVISLLTGSPGAFTSVACNDDIDSDVENYQSIIDYVPVTNSTTYYVQVSAWDPDGMSSANTLEVSFAVTATSPVPANDTYAGAEVIATDSYTDIEMHPHLATSEVSDPQPSCRFLGPHRGSNSMWYTYTPPHSGYVTISTAGSTSAFSDTMLALYTGTPGSLTEVACDEDTEVDLTSRIDGYLVSAGTTYTIYVARWSTAAAQTPGTLQLTIAFNLLDNGGFEASAADGIPAGWQRSGPGSTDDKRMCGGADTFASTGDCAYRFKGSAGEASVVKQKVTAAEIAASGITPADGSTFKATVMIQGNKSNADVIMKIKFTDGTPAVKAFTPAGNAPTYIPITVEAVAPSGSVKFVQLQIKSLATGGKTYIDDATLTYEGVLTRSDTPMPPPSAPGGFRGTN